MFFIKNLVIIILLLTVISSCSSVEVREDRDPAYLDVGYLSVETTLCNQTTSGINICYFKDGQKTEGLNLKIQGIIDGEMSVYGGICGVDRNIRYVDNGVVEIPLSSIFGDFFDREESCTITVDVYLDPIKGSDISLRGRRGKIIFEILPDFADDFPKSVVTDGKYNFGLQLRVTPSLSDKVARDIPRWMAIDLGEGTAGDYRIQGCDFEIEDRFENGSNIFIDLKSLLEKIKRSCKMQFAAVTDSGKAYYWVYYVNIFKVEAIILPAPIITFKKKSGSTFICVEASEATTSLTSINNTYLNDNKLCVKYIEDTDYFIRTITVNRNSLTLFRNGETIWTL